MIRSEAHTESLTEAELRFARRAVRRRALFLHLSRAGIAFAAGLAAYSVYRWFHDPGFETGLRGVVVLLILLNARQNLRQYRYAGILARLLGGDGARA